MEGNNLLDANMWKLQHELIVEKNQLHQYRLDGSNFDFKKR